MGVRTGQLRDQEKRLCFGATRSYRPDCAAHHDCLFHSGRRWPPNDVGIQVDFSTSRVAVEHAGGEQTVPEAPAAKANTSCHNDQYMSHTKMLCRD